MFLEATGLSGVSTVEAPNAPGGFASDKSGGARERQGVEEQSKAHLDLHRRARGKFLL
jgi:hypothetical protein